MWPLRAGTLNRLRAFYAWNVSHTVPAGQTLKLCFHIATRRQHYGGGEVAAAAKPTATVVTKNTCSHIYVRRDGSATVRQRFGGSVVLGLCISKMQSRNKGKIFAT
ncbi:hypothetical protein V1264_007484 [Littorina saxatilis]|uniref:Uncharacterized protein n=1 Tax=Littorina saxatilis TaxID=31220 RepID=A0AAN9AVF8_9CAEN